MAVAESFQAEVTATPGANRSTQAPWFENGARRSAASVAPTVRACGTEAGDPPQAFLPSLPAAATKVIPEATTRRTAASRARLRLPPMLMLATAGLRGARAASRTTQSRPLIMADRRPSPRQSATFTATRETPLATPNVFPPTVPATCVPWPLQSRELSRNTALCPARARPPNSWWRVLIPVSRT